MIVEGLVIFGLLGFFIGVPCYTYTYHTPLKQQPTIINPFHPHNNIQ